MKKLFLFVLVLALFVTPALAGCAKNYTSGLKFSLEGEAYSVTAYKGDEVNVVIPEKYLGKPVTKIGKDVFNKTYIESVSIPASVKVIGDTAFAGCEHLKEVLIADKSQLEQIGASAFYLCPSLESIRIPASLKEIGTGAFSECDSLKTVYLDDIAAWCEVKIGADGSSNQQKPVFYSYGQTPNYNNPYLNTQKDIYNTQTNRTGGASYSGSPLSGAETLYVNGEMVRDIVIPEGVTKISSCSFGGVKNIQSVYIPSSVTMIEGDAFNWFGLSTVYYDGTEEEWNAILTKTANYNASNVKIEFKK